MIKNKSITMHIQYEKCTPPYVGGSGGGSVGGSGGGSVGGSGGGSVGGSGGYVNVISLDLLMSVKLSERILVFGKCCLIV
jgi:hypothetical protein